MSIKILLTRVIFVLMTKYAINSQSSTPVEMVYVVHLVPDLTKCLLVEQSKRQVTNLV